MAHTDARNSSSSNSNSMASLLLHNGNVLSKSMQNPNLTKAQLTLHQDEFGEGMIWEQAVVAMGGNPNVSGSDAALNRVVARGAVPVSKNEDGFDMCFMPKQKVGKR